MTTVEGKAGLLMVSGGLGENDGCTGPSPQVLSLTTSGCEVSEVSKDTAFHLHTSQVYTSNAHTLD